MEKGKNLEVFESNDASLDYILPKTKVLEQPEKESIKRPEVQLHLGIENEIKGY